MTRGDGFDGSSRKRCPILGRAGWQLEVPRQDADNGHQPRRVALERGARVEVVAEFDGRTDHSRITTETAAPRVEAQDDDVRVGVVAGVEGAAQKGPRAKQREGIRRHVVAPQARDAVGGPHVGFTACYGKGVGDRSTAAAPVEKLLIGEAALRGWTPGKHRRDVLDDAREPIGVREREGLEQGGVDHTVDGRRRADAQRERQDRDDCEAGRLSQYPNRVAQIAHARIRPRFRTLDTAAA